MHDLIRSLRTVFRANDIAYSVEGHQKHIKNSLIVHLSLIMPRAKFECLLGLKTTYSPLLSVSLCP